MKTDACVLDVKIPKKFAAITFDQDFHIQVTHLKVTKFIISPIDDCESLNFRPNCFCEIPPSAYSFRISRTVSRIVSSGWTFSCWSVERMQGMIAYHYTSIENYWHISSEGLVPYSINKPDLVPHFPSGLTGIWLWKRDLTGDEHLGSILWQLMTKSSTCVVKLQVEYDVSKLLYRNGEPVEILHDGRLGTWVYHTKTPAVVYADVIAPGDPPACDLRSGRGEKDAVRFVLDYQCLCKWRSEIRCPGSTPRFYGVRNCVNCEGSLTE